MAIDRGRPNPNSIKKYIKKVKNRSYLSKDFESFRTELLQYAQAHFSENINDFTDASVGGLLLDMAAYIGDSMSYYLDHQFSELSLETAVETKNIDRLLRQAGVKYMGSSPAIAEIKMFLRVGGVMEGTNFSPNKNYLPTVKAGTTFLSSAGIKFELLDDVEFGKTSVNGDLLCEYKIADDNSSTFIVTKTGYATSASDTTETFIIPDTFVPFRKITLTSTNVSEIISITDSELNEYYEVESLSQDTVFKKFKNTGKDRDLVSDSLKLTPAPYRFIAMSDRTTGKTTIRFGSGDADTLDDDIIPDPSELALPLFGDRKTISRFSLDPNLLLKTKTLGISPKNTTLTVRYRSGGGLDGNVGSNQINGIKSLIVDFNDSVPITDMISIRSSIDVTNELPAAGGENPPTLGELKSIALSYRNAQSRIVTKQDLISRIYMMPSNFGRVFRVGIKSNNSNPLATTVAIASRNSEGKLIISPDTLKNNLKEYLNQYRLITDAIDIVDALPANIAIEYSIVANPTMNKNAVISKINADIKSFTMIENFQIDQPLIISDIANMILNTNGVISVVSIEIKSLTGTVSGRSYLNSVGFNTSLNNDRGIIHPPKGTIFEIRYPNTDIKGKAI